METVMRLWAEYEEVREQYDREYSKYKATYARPESGEPGEALPQACTEEVHRELNRLAEDAETKRKAWMKAWREFFGYSS